MAFIVSARYGSMHYIGDFISETDDFRLRDKVLLRTDRGTETGETLSIPGYVPRGTDTSECGQLIRKMTREDFQTVKQIEEELVPAEVKVCQQLIRDHRIAMKLATVEHLFGGEKIIFYFLAEGRVDFRGLVKDLAAQYRTRIEMRQIGVRDEARLLADYEHCGQPLCCKSFMRELQPVSMRMAKLQKTTLDPAKISGRCGRLMCCLRFEDEVYLELKNNLPNKGDTVATADKSGKVLSKDILGQTVTIDCGDGVDITVGIDEIKEVVSQQGKGKKKKKKRSDGEQSGGENRNGPRDNSSGSGNHNERGPGNAAGKPADAEEDDAPGAGGGGTNENPQGPQEGKT